jgi:alpha-beta hydrolase superfamily lysophospholipase
MDVRARYAERRRALAATACPDAKAASLVPATVELPGAPGIETLGGSVRSIAAGVRASGGQASVPVLLALPTAWDAGTPLVLLVHGHGSRAEAFLKTHAPGLLARGLAALAIDLPGHGRRTGEPAFIDIAAPERLPASIEQAAVDALAVIRFALQCGFRLADGRTYRPSEVLYLGYSVGSMVGTIVRAVEEDLGTTVLLAPGADLVEWPTVQAPKRLGAGAYTVCRDGPRRGAPCLTADVCETAGACAADPQVLLLSDLLRASYEPALAHVEPAAFATERTGSASHAPLLLVAGGKDFTLTPLMVGRLADAYGMRASTHGRRGAHARLVWWPELGHELATDDRVKQQAHTFLASRGRRDGVPSPSGR